MLTMTEYNLIIAEYDMGPKCHAIFNVYSQAGVVTPLPGDCYNIRIFSAEEQEKLYEQFKAAMAEDFPAEDDTPADECDKPCVMTCPKCGSADMSRTHYEPGKHFSAGIGVGRSSDFVDRSDRYCWFVRSECIVHHCRSCQYYFDTAPLPNSDDTVQKRE